MIRLLAAFIATLLLSHVAAAQVQNAPAYTPIQCNAAAQYSSSVAGTTQIVAAVTGRAIYLCGWDVSAAAGSTLQIAYGTGTNCGTGTTNITPAFAPTNTNDSSPFFRGLQAPLSQALCIVQTGAVAVQALVFYGQY
jgi:hypothetical protein